MPFCILSLLPYMGQSIFHNHGFALHSQVWEEKKQHESWSPQQRLSTVFTEKNIQKVEVMILGDWTCISQDIEEYMNIESENVAEILHTFFFWGHSNLSFDIEAGEVSWISSKTQKEWDNMQFACSIRTISPTQQSFGNKVLATFPNVSDHMVTFLLKHWVIMNAEWYITLCQPKVSQKA